MRPARLFCEWDVGRVRTSRPQPFSDEVRLNEALMELLEGTVLARVLSTTSQCGRASSVTSMPCAASSGRWRSPSSRSMAKPELAKMTFTTSSAPKNDAMLGCPSLERNSVPGMLER